MPTSSPVGLTREQEQDFLKYTKVEEYFLVPTNLTKVNAYAPLQTRFGVFEGNMANVAPIAQGKIVTSDGATTNKISLKHDVANFVGVYAKVSRGFCLRSDVNLPIVAANLNFTESSIFKMEDGSILTTVTAINKAINDNLIPLATFTPYNIDAAMLGDGLTRATNFNNALGIGGAIMAGKTASEGDIAALFKLLHDDEVQFKHLMPFFKLSDANFYNGFVAADVEDDLIRHNNVAGHVYVANPADMAHPVPIPNATIKNTTSGLIVKANLLGEYDLSPNRTGLTSVEVSAPDYVMQAQVVHIKRGSTIHVDWFLVHV